MRALWLSCLFAVACDAAQDKATDDTATTDDSVETDSPAVTLAEAAIDAGGGTLEIDGVQLTVPPGAVDSLTLLSIRRTDATVAGARSPLFAFAPDGLQFAVPARVRMDFEGDAPVHIQWTDDDGLFQPLSTGVNGQVAVADIAHFSTGFVAGGQPTVAPIDTGDSGGTGTPGDSTADSDSPVDSTSDSDTGGPQSAPGAPVSADSCSGSFTITYPNGNHATVDPCIDATVAADWAYDPDGPDHFANVTLGFNSFGPGRPLACGLTVNTDQLCGVGTYPIAWDSHHVEIATTDCPNTVPQDEGQFVLDLGYIKVLDLQQWPSDPLPNDPIELSIEVQLHAQTLDGLMVEGTANVSANLVLGHGPPNPTCAPGPFEWCGDHVVDPGETCDDGNPIDEDGCDAQCHVEVCGNGFRQFTEECDDGNLDDNDGCNAACELEYCGDGIVQTGIGEECDPRGANCNQLCRRPGCGDGVWDSSTEYCDVGDGRCSGPCFQGYIRYLDPPPTPVADLGVFVGIAGEWIAASSSAGVHMWKQAGDNWVYDQDILSKELSQIVLSASGLLVEHPGSGEPEVLEYVNGRWTVQKTFWTLGAMLQAQAYGTGFLVHAENGFVFVDRGTGNWSIVGQPIARPDGLDIGRFTASGDVMITTEGAPSTSANLWRRTSSGDWLLDEDGDPPPINRGFGLGDGRMVSVKSTIGCDVTLWHPDEGAWSMTNRACQFGNPCHNSIVATDTLIACTTDDWRSGTYPTTSSSVRIYRFIPLGLSPLPIPDFGEYLPSERVFYGKNPNNSAIAADADRIVYTGYDADTDDSTLVVIVIDAAACGNGTVDIGELCDDGNTTNGDGCSDICQPD